MTKKPLKPFLNIKKRMKNKDIESLYVHIPFCECLCNYCDFTKLQYFHIFVKPYLENLQNELKSYEIKNMKTIYIGGGTPTCLKDDEFETLLKMVEPYSKEVIEYTVEANPESLTDSKLKLMKKYGVNRISIGVESTNDKILRSINRNHTFEDVKTAINTAKEFGFTNINVDLILGLPNVTMNLLKEDIENVLALNINHISCYSLTVHDHTVFGIKKIKEPSEDFSRDAYDTVHNLLCKHGYNHYEISNFAKKGYESLHNLTYWKDERYYGCGLGASGFVNNIRYTNTRSISEYNAGKRISEKEEITVNDDKEYYIMLNLRTMFGISYKDYQERFGEDFYIKYREPIESNVKAGFLVKNELGIRPTYAGMMILDKIILDFLSD